MTCFSDDLSALAKVLEEAKLHMNPQYAHGAYVTLRVETLIEANDIAGPFSLNHTIRSGQTSEPEWQSLNMGYWDVEFINQRCVKHEVYSEGVPSSPRLRVAITSETVDDDLCAATKQYLRSLFRLDDNLEEFYDAFRDDPLVNAFNKLQGLRLMQASNLFESLICSICSQHASVKMWNVMAQLIKRIYGEQITFPDGAVFYTFPKPEKLSEASERDLESICKTGYRAKYILAASKLIVKGELNLYNLKNLPYDVARKKLMELPGVGPKVADCFLLYGVGCTQAAPVDVWMHRIVSKLYFDNAKISKEKAAKFLRDRFRGWAGYAQIYLFHYARSFWAKKSVYQA